MEFTQSDPITHPHLSRTDKPPPEIVHTSPTPPQIKSPKAPRNGIPCTWKHGCQGQGHQPTYSCAFRIEGIHRACFPEPEGTWRWPVWASVPSHHSSASFLLSNNPPVLPWWKPYITETGEVDQMSWQKQGWESGIVPPVPTITGGLCKMGRSLLDTSFQERSPAQSWGHQTPATLHPMEEMVLLNQEVSHELYINDHSRGWKKNKGKRKILVNQAASTMNIYINTLWNSAAFQLIQDFPRFIMNLKSYIRQSHSSISKSA